MAEPHHTAPAPTPELINTELRDHVARIKDWKYKDILVWLYTWAEKFIREFHLEIPIPAIQISTQARNVAGAFLPERNGFGILYTLILNATYINSESQADLLDTLAHELLHSYQSVHGKPGKNNYHNREYREKARSIGLVVDKKGRSLGILPNTPFTALLEHASIPHAHLLQENYAPQPRQADEKKTKLKKWSCACPVNIRVAVELHARCLDCGEEFYQTKPSW